jgi:hypothetical protein
VTRALDSLMKLAPGPQEVLGTRMNVLCGTLLDFIFYMTPKCKAAHRMRTILIEVTFCV